MYSYNFIIVWKILCTFDIYVVWRPFVMWCGAFCLLAPFMAIWRPFLYSYNLLQYIGLLCTHNIYIYCKMEVCHSIDDHAFLGIWM